MFNTQTITLQTRVLVDDLIGGKTTTWAEFKTVQAYLDLLSGSDENAPNNAFMERSTHILIIPDFTESITDDMRVVDSAGRWYEITYADDPVGQGHHNELYLKYGGVI